MNIITDEHEILDEALFDHIRTLQCRAQGQLRQLAIHPDVWPQVVEIVKAYDPEPGLGVDGDIVTYCGIDLFEGRDDAWKPQ